MSNLSDRAPKAQPKSAVPSKSSTSGTRGKTRGAKKARNPRPAKKTAEELDSEMADYWESGATNSGDVAATSGTAQAANGDANMDEEILVSRVRLNDSSVTNRRIVNFFRSFTRMIFDERAMGHHPSPNIFLFPTSQAYHYCITATACN